MSEQGKGSTEIDNDPAAKAATLLLANYHFDLAGYPAGELVERWLNHHPADWVRLAVIEALYQGRYKAISVEQILSIWQRRNQVLHHFNYEFERLICNKLPQELTQQLPLSAADSSEAYRKEDENEIDVSPWDEEAAEKAATSSHPFEAIVKPLTMATTSVPEFPQPQLSSVSPTVEVETQEANEPNLEPSSVQQTKSISVGSTNHQPPAKVEENPFDNSGLDDLPIEESIPDPPFFDFFTKLKALAHQHQETLIAEQENKETEAQPGEESNPAVEVGEIKVQSGNEDNSTLEAGEAGEQTIE